jgi:hypothetical protein
MRAAATSNAEKPEMPGSGLVRARLWISIPGYEIAPAAGPAYRELILFNFMN